MSIRKITNIFSDDELSDLNNIINNKYIPTLDNGEYIQFNMEADAGIDQYLGRLQFNLSEELKNPNISIRQKINDIAEECFYANCKLPWSLRNILYVNYSGKYGTPNLPPHFDGEVSDIIINFQLDSNTSWDLGIGTTLYKLENNSAVVFNANENIHWRPHKDFTDDEYVKMIFFRFCTHPATDYSDKAYSQDHPIYQEAREFRDSLNQH